LAASFVEAPTHFFGKGLRVLNGQKGDGVFASVCDVITLSICLSIIFNAFFGGKEALAQGAVVLI